MTNPEMGRLRWRCRRGMLELDLLLADFLERGYSDLDERGRTYFEQLLESQDKDLIAWLMGDERAKDDTLQGLVEKIRTVARS